MRVANHVTELHFVCKTEQVWDVISWIAWAEAVLGASLYIKIVSFVFLHKPQVNWCAFDDTKNTKGTQKQILFM